MLLLIVQRSACSSSLHCHLFSLILHFAALTVKYITRRFIMEYDPCIGNKHLQRFHHRRRRRRRNHRRRRRRRNHRRRRRRHHHHHHHHHC